MSLFEFVGSQVALSFMLIITIFTFLFFMVIYITAERYKSVLFVALANAVKIVEITLSYVELSSSGLNFEPIRNALSSVEVTFWVVAIFIILKLRIKLWPLILLNSINFIQGALEYFVSAAAEYANLFNSLVIAVIIGYCTVRVIRRRMRRPRTENIILVVSLISFIVFHLIRGAICLIGIVSYNNVTESVSDITMITVLRYAFFHFMNFLIIYLNMSYLMRKVRRLSYTDKLTGVFNRNFFLKLLEVKLSDLKRMKNDLVLAMIDIDDFKNVNDQFGHLVGDRALREFTDNLKNNIRQNDVICRYGGEEFLILMEVAGEAEAKQALERLRKSTKDRFFTENNIKMTFSCGMEYLSANNNGRKIEKLIGIIDERLYEAKHAGKDRII